MTINADCHHKDLATYNICFDGHKFPEKSHR